MKSIYRLIFIGLAAIGVAYAGQGLEQKHLLSISPNSTEVTSKSSFVFTFDMPILQTSAEKKHCAQTENTTTTKNIYTIYSLGQHTNNFTQCTVGTRDICIENKTAQAYQRG